MSVSPRGPWHAKEVPSGLQSGLRGDGGLFGWEGRLLGDVSLGVAQRAEGEGQGDQDGEDADRGVDQHDVVSALDGESSEERAQGNGGPGEDAGDTDDPAQEMVGDDGLPQAAGVDVEESSGPGAEGEERDGDPEPGEQREHDQ